MQKQFALEYTKTCSALQAVDYNLNFRRDQVEEKLMIEIIYWEFWRL